MHSRRCDAAVDEIEHILLNVKVVYHDLFWRTLRLVPLAGLFKSIHIMTVVAALKLNHVKMYWRIC